MTWSVAVFEPAFPGLSRAATRSSAPSTRDRRTLSAGGGRRSASRLGPRFHRQSAQSPAPIQIDVDRSVSLERFPPGNCQKMLRTSAAGSGWPKEFDRCKRRGCQSRGRPLDRRRLARPRSARPAAWRRRRDCLRRAPPPARHQSKIMPRLCTAQAFYHGINAAHIAVCNRPCGRSRQTARPRPASTLPRPPR